MVGLKTSRRAGPKRDPFLTPVRAKSQVLGKDLKGLVRLTRPLAAAAVLSTGHCRPGSTPRLLRVLCGKIGSPGKETYERSGLICDEEV